jgi:hypothetical protein
LQSSEKIEEFNIYYIRLSNGGRIRVQARFANLDDTRFDEFCGRVVTYTKRDGETIIREVTSIRAGDDRAAGADRAASSTPPESTAAVQP